MALPNVRTIFLSALLSVTVFAGCIKETPAPTTPADPPVTYEIPPLPKVDAAAFLVNHSKFVKAFPQRAGNSPTHVGSREALAAEFASVGLAVYRQNFTNGIDQQNVCGVKIGLVYPTEWVIVGGHYDTTTWDSLADDSPPGSMISEGAYDDGSGTWITVEVAKAFAPQPTAYSVLFCGYDGEERGIQGARALRQIMDEALSGNIDEGGEIFPYNVTAYRAILDLDMIGINWPVRAPIHVTQNNKVLFDKVSAYAHDVLKIPADMFLEKSIALGSSDYAAWMSGAKPVPGLFFISDFQECAVPTPVENPAPVPGVPCTYPFWHWMDTVETMQAMAGGAEMLRKAFQTALDLSIYTVAIEAQHDEVVFRKTPK